MAVVPGEDRRDPLVEVLEADLVRTQEQLRNLVGESAISTEELRAPNEELQTINEELRSTTEELETSREELQSVNEELTTVNSELTLRIEDMGKVSDDLQNLMSSADIGTVFVDRDMRVKRFTPQAATLFNLLPGDQGRPLLDITHRIDYPELAQDVVDVLRDLRRIEREVVSRDSRCFLVRVVPYRTNDDRIEGAVLAFFDISARRAVERQLRLSEQRMSLVAENMPDYAIVTLDAEGVITSWSAGATGIFGYEPEEAIGEPLALIFTEEDRVANEPVAEMAKSREEGRAADDRWHVRKDGQRIYCSGIMTPLGEAGSGGFAKICRDLTGDELRHKQQEATLEEERATRSRLQEANAMKDEFLAVVSHELKNPLSVIQMNAQLLARTPGAGRDARVTRLTDGIKSAVMSQAQIINDLLELSMANVGKVVLSPAFVDLQELVRNVLRAVAPDVEAKGQNVQAEIGSARILADAVRVEQIVWNLVTNAVKFTPEGGSVRVELAVDGSMAKLTVVDTGIGIEPRHLSNIFEMFRQVDTGTSRKKMGLGIGLALVKKLVELHEGRVQAESDGVGLGARFSVWLPMTSEGPTHVPQGRRGTVDQLRILLVDDEQYLLTAFGALLESEGAHVTLADNAEQALALAQGQAFDAVISDVAMPEHDGYWLATRLREGVATRELALIAVSGMARGVDHARAIAAGFDVHLSKPLDYDLLTAELVRTLEKR